MSSPASLLDPHSDKGAMRSQVCLNLRWLHGAWSDGERVCARSVRCQAVHAHLLAFFFSGSAMLRHGLPALACALFDGPRQYRCCCLLLFAPPRVLEGGAPPPLGFPQRTRVT